MEFVTGTETTERQKFRNQVQLPPGMAVRGYAAAFITSGVEVVLQDQLGDNATAALYA